MAKCEMVQQCIFTTDFANNLPAQIALIKRTYCNQGYEFCARYLTAKHINQDAVPTNLHPADISQALKIIGRQVAA